MQCFCLFCYNYTVAEWFFLRFRLVVSEYSYAKKTWYMCKKVLFRSEDLWVYNYKLFTPKAVSTSGKKTTTTKTTKNKQKQTNKQKHNQPMHTKSSEISITAHACPQTVNSENFRDHTSRHAVPPLGSTPVDIGPGYRPGGIWPIKIQYNPFLSGHDGTPDETKHLEKNLPYWSSLKLTPKNYWISHQ